MHARRQQRSPFAGPPVKAVEPGARFSVVIVNYNGGPMLLACVSSAVREGVPASRIILVDNGSHDDSLANLLQKFPEVVILRNPCNAGFARAVNSGIQVASTEFILLLNNDAQLEPEALRALAEGFDRFPSLAIAGGQLRYPDGRLQNAFAPLPSLVEEILPLSLLKLIDPVRFRRKSVDNRPIFVDCVFGACLCVRRSVLPPLGFLDEGFFFFFEEIDWCRRAQRLGFEVCHLPAAKAVHGGGLTANRFRGPARVEYQRSKLTYFRKASGTAGYVAVSVVLFLRTLVNALAGGVACLATLFLNRRLRTRAATYWYLVCWHILLRPASWGLPGKCPRAGGM